MFLSSFHFPFCFYRSSVDSFLLIFHLFFLWICPAPSRHLFGYFHKCGIGPGRVSCLETFTTTFLFCSSIVRNVLLPNFFHPRPRGMTHLAFQNLGGWPNRSSLNHTLFILNLVMLFILLQWKATLKMIAIVCWWHGPSLYIPNHVVVSMV